MTVFFFVLKRVLDTCSFWKPGRTEVPRCAEGSRQSVGFCWRLCSLIWPHIVSSPAVLAVLAIGPYCAAFLLDKWAVCVNSVHKATAASDWNSHANNEFKLGNSVTQGIIWMKSPHSVLLMETLFKSHC